MQWILISTQKIDDGGGIKKKNSKEAPERPPL
jgi:hypothetical protein